VCIGGSASSGVRCRMVSGTEDRRHGAGVRAGRTHAIQDVSLDGLVVVLRGRALPAAATTTTTTTTVAAAVHQGRALNGVILCGSRGRRNSLRVNWHRHGRLHRLRPCPLALSGSLLLLLLQHRRGSGKKIRKARRGARHPMIPRLPHASRVYHSAAEGYGWGNGAATAASYNRPASGGCVVEWTRRSYGYGGEKSLKRAMAQDQERATQPARARRPGPASSEHGKKLAERGGLPGVGRWSGQMVGDQARERRLIERRSVSIVALLPGPSSLAATTEEHFIHGVMAAPFGKRKRHSGGPDVSENHRPRRGRESQQQQPATASDSERQQQQPATAARSSQQSAAASASESQPPPAKATLRGTGDVCARRTQPIAPPSITAALARRLRLISPIPSHPSILKQ